MKGSLKYLRKRLCVIGLAVASVFAGVAAPMVVSTANVEVAEAATTESVKAWMDRYNETAKPNGYSYNNNRGECVALFDWYMQENFGIKHASSGCLIASNIWNKNYNGFQKIAKNNISSYKVGDVVIWSGNPGHVAMVYSVNGSNVSVIEQNYRSSTGKIRYPQVHSINRSGTILGVFRPDLDDYDPWDGLTEVQVSEGYYILNSGTGNRFLDICGESRDDRASAQIYSPNGSGAQIFYIYKKGDGYKIRNLTSGKFLDTTTATSLKNPNYPKGKDNVMQLTEDNSPGQLWKIHDAGGGYVYISNFHKYFLDVDNGTNEDGRNVQTWDRNDSAAQKWKLTKVSGKTKKTDIAAGDYYIQSKIGDKNLETSGRSKEPGANMLIWSPHGATSQVFTVGWNWGTCLTFINKNSGKYVDTEVAKGIGNVIQADRTLNKTQTWFAEDAGGGYVYIRNLWGYYLDVYNGDNVSGANVWAYTFNGTDAQKWKFVKYIPVTGVSLNTTTLSLIEGNNGQLTASVSPAEALNKKVFWSSSNTAAATVDSNGKITAVKPGTAIITAKTEDSEKTATCTVTVRAKTIDINSYNFPDANFRKYISEVLDTDKDGKLNSSEIEKIQTIHCESRNISDLTGIGYFTELKNLYCTNNNLSSLDVSQNKKLEWLNCNNNKLKSLDVTNNTSLMSLECANNALTSLKLSDSVTTLSCSKNKLTELDVRRLRYLHDLSCSNNDLYALDLSQNEDLFSLYCDNNHLVELRLPHKIDYYSYGGQTREIESVDGYIPPEGYNFNVDWNKVSNLKGAVREDAIWYRITKNVVTYDYDTGLGKPMNVTLKVDGAISTVAVSGVTLNTGNMTLNVGATGQLKATVTPSDASNKKVKWSSNDTSVATVDSNGKVTAKKAGSAKITVKTEDGGKTATCTVTVKAAATEATGISLDKKLLVLDKGKSGKLTATVKPDNATNKTVTWSSSNTGVAKVDKNGNVTAVNHGTAKITAKTSNGKTAECEVRVNFIDVTNPKDWYYKPVYWAAEKGITTGTDGKFFHSDNCTREQAITFLWRMAGKPDPKNMTSRFSDVKDSKRYSYKAIMWGNENGIITGTDGKFYPTGTCTREQIVTMIWRLAGKPEPKNMNSKFKDVTSKTRYSYKAVMWAAEKGITTGTNGLFYPTGQCKRREIVTFIYRYKN